MKTVLAVLLLFLGACGAASHPVVDLVPVGTEPEATPLPPPPRPRPPRPDVLTRGRLDATLDAGPGAFLGTVKLRASTSGGRFVGWEVLEMDARYAAAGLMVGDIIRRVNGQRVERPDDLIGLWQILRTADSLEFDVLRAGADEVVRVPVEP